MKKSFTLISLARDRDSTFFLPATPVPLTDESAKKKQADQSSSIQSEKDEWNTPRAPTTVSPSSAE